ncbi:MAG TPA: transglutaminase domain-containing protein [archaeon]|nr:transglutaminase domain-containing protein [archaeon]
MIRCRTMLAASPLLAVFVIFAAVSMLTAGEERSFSRVVASAEEEFIIEVGGTLDPENIEVTVENLGPTPVVDPRISVNGKFDWYDIDSMVKEITEGCRTDEEKALAIWEWVHWKRFQRSPQDSRARHPVIAMNCYGYGICGFTAAWLKALFTSAGLPAKIQEIWHHTVNEVYYDGAWHYFDGNGKVFYLARDNRTVASLAELEQDGWLVERTIHAPFDPWVRPGETPELTREFVSWITSADDNYEEHSHDEEIEKDYKMSYNLKPGERLIRWWQGVLGKYESSLNRPVAPERYANGQLIWEPDLDQVDMLDYLKVIENISTSGHNGRKPAIHINRLHDKSYSRPARFTIPIRSPYPAIGGRFWCTLVREGNSRLDDASVFWGFPDFEPGNLARHRGRYGPFETVELCLDHHIDKEEPLYGYEVGFSLLGNAGSNPPTQSGVSWFKSVTDLQVSPHSLPALSLGRNLIRYRDSSTAPGKKVRLSWKWRERDNDNPPGRITRAVSPADRAEVATLTPRLQWRPAEDPDQGDRVTDYQVMVSLRPDCRWPLSMSLYQNVGSPECAWTVPGSFLNPGTTYYWKIRARDSRQEAGNWGEIFSFRTAENAGKSEK